MTRKHYIAIAKKLNAIVNETEDEMDRVNLLSVAEAIADVMEDDNERFDRSKFLEACGF